MTRQAALGEALGNAGTLPRPGTAEQDPLENFVCSGARARARLQPVLQLLDELESLPIASLPSVLTVRREVSLGIDADWQPVMQFDSPLDTRSTPLKHRMMAIAGERIFQLSGASPTYGQRLL